jgi:DNA mismatch endonuclease Vsr
MHHHPAFDRRWEIEARMSTQKHPTPPRPDFADVSSTRRRNMAAIRGKDTKPEMLVRRMLHALGYRFRLHRRDLPGRPDIVLPGRRKAIFVHGCFWHQHGCPKSTLPQSRRQWWEAKLRGNVARDRRNEVALAAEGWEVLTVWECDGKDQRILTMRLLDFLGSPGSTKVPSMVEKRRHAGS